jgi:hypothetical protein
VDKSIAVKTHMAVIAVLVGVVFWLITFCYGLHRPLSPQVSHTQPEEVHVPFATIEDMQVLVAELEACKEAK